MSTLRWARASASVLITGLTLLAQAGAPPRGTQQPAEPLPPIEPRDSTAEKGLWRLAPDELWTQRLFRMHYDGPEGDGAFRLTLRLASPELFQMTAVDRFSRRWWSLSVAAGEALFLDHRNETYCRYAGEIEISAVPLGPLPFSTLPALLLGHLPMEAARPGVLNGNELSFFDRRGRKWTARVAGERVDGWTLWRDQEPQVWWQIQGSNAFLSARQEGLQLRWREVVSEPISPPLSTLQLPSGYRPGVCEEGALQ